MSLESQEARRDLAGWFWLWVSHVIVVKMLACVSVTQRLAWVRGPPCTVVPHMVAGRRPMFLTTWISSLHRLLEHPPDMTTGFLQHKLAKKSRGNHHTFCGLVLGVTYSYSGLISFVRSKILNLTYTQREGIRIHLCKVC